MSPNCFSPRGDREPDIVFRGQSHPTLMAGAELAVAVAGALIFAELFTGFVIYPLRWGRSYYRVISENFIFMFDRATGYRLRSRMRYSNPSVPLPNAPRRIMMVDVRTEENGFLTDMDLAREPGRKIFCIGGSTTAGIESRHDRHYPAALDRLMRPRGYRVINAGVGGYRSIHELRLFTHKILPLRPWGVILYTGYNDFEDYVHGISAPYDPFRHCLGHGLPTNTFENWLRYSALWYFVKRSAYTLLERVRTESAPRSGAVGFESALKNPVWLDEWSRNVGQIMETCRSHGIRCFILGHVSPVYPGASGDAKEYADHDLNMDGRFDAFVQYVARIDEEAKALCREHEAVFLDVGPCFEKLFLKSDGAMDFRKRFGAFVDRAHLTEEGNERLARCIFETIEGNL